MKARSLVLLLTAACLVASGCKRNPKTDETNSKAPETNVEQTHDFPTSTTPNAATPESRSDMGEETPAQKLEKQLQPIFFAFDKYDLSEDSRDRLTGNARVLRDNPGFNVTIEGHCDERGTNEYNLALGDRRARAARDFLVQSGLPSSRFTIVSYGEERPFAYGHDESAWSQNRRDHFRVPEPR